MNTQHILPKQILLFLFLSTCICTTNIYAQSRKKNVNIDSTIYHLRIQDSIQIRELSTQLQDMTSQLQEMKLNEIIRMNEESSKGKLDSLKKIQQKNRIDSLRLITQGTPVIIEDDTLFILYARNGGVFPADRAKKAQDVITQAGKRLTIQMDSVHIYAGEFTSDIMVGDKVIISITDQDGLWQNTTRNELAIQYVPVVTQKIADLHAQYGLQKKMRSLLLLLAVIIGQIILIKLTNKLFQILKKQAHQFVLKKFKPVTIKGYEFLNIKKQETVLFMLLKILKYVVIIIQLLISLLLIFSIFPQTEHYVYLIFSYIWNPAKDICISFIKFIPNLFKITLICILFRYIIKGMKYFFTEISNENLKINGFFPDWAMPTFTILRFMAYCFMVVMIWPLLPSAESPIFQGVSVFVGLIVSLGSTAVIGNLMAGFVITYMRPFIVGDQIKMGETVGKVIEKSPFVVRIQTPKKEIITIPNSFVLSSHTVNYSTSAKDSGVVIYSDVSVGYEVPREQVEQILIDAALKTEGVLNTPQPFVLVRSLADFYCCYQINAHTKDDQTLPKIYSALHKNIIDTFNEAGVEIMSPHIYAMRDGNNIMMPDQYKKTAKQ